MLPTQLENLTEYECMGENGRWNTRDVEGEKIMMTAIEIEAAEGGREAVEETEVDTTTAAGEQECAHPEESIESKCTEFLQLQVGKI